MPIFYIKVTVRGMLFKKAIYGSESDYTKVQLRKFHLDYINEIEKTLLDLKNISNELNEKIDNSYDHLKGFF